MVEGSRLSPDPERGRDAEEEIDILEYARLAWRRRWVIVAGTLVFAAIGLATARSTPVMYTATAKLEIPPSRVEPGVPPWSPAIFGTVLDDNSVGRRVAAEVHTPVVAFQVQPVPDTTFHSVTVSMPERALAVKAANRVTELAVDAARAYEEKADLEARRLSEAQFQEARVAVERAAQALDAAGKGRAPSSFGSGLQYGSLEADYQLAAKLFVDAGRRLDGLRYNAVFRARATRVIERAVAATPTPRNTARKAVIAGMAGLTLTLLGVLLFESLARLRASARRESGAAARS